MAVGMRRQNMVSAPACGCDCEVEPPVMVEGEVDEATVPLSTVNEEACDSVGEKEWLFRLISRIGVLVDREGRIRPSLLDFRCFPLASTGSSAVGGTPRYSSA